MRKSRQRPLTLLLFGIRASRWLAIPWFVFGLFGCFSRLSGREKEVLSGEMAFAYFIGHAPKGFYPLTNGGESAVLFCFIFLCLAAAEGGAWSLDALRGKA